jgi:WXXGXW repeat (2 copies)
MGRKLPRLTSVRAALAGLALTALPMASFGFVSVGVSINIAPPALPVYVQPPCPAVGYIWTPGYWGYDDGDYYWVPGTWVLAPAPGLLWTPGYWGWVDGGYIWHAGYWGPHVGFYGGVNYGYGYTGVGFEGGYWRGGSFYYNRSVANLGGLHVTNVYNRTIVNNINVTRVSYNGGEGGLRARPTGRELTAEHDHHVPFTSAQREQEHTAFGNHDLRASVNGGKPRIAATERPGVFSGKGVIAARAAGAPYHGHEHGGPGSGADIHAGGPAHIAARTDRPPGASGSAEIRGGTGGGSSHGAAFRSEAASTGHGGAAMAHNDRPSGASSSFRSGSNGGSAGSGQIHNEAVRGPQPHVSHGNEMHEMSQGPRFGGPSQPVPHPSAQPTPRPFVGEHGGGQPHPQAAPHSQPQAAGPRPEAHRGGSEPRGQGRPQPQGRGGPQEPNHGRR